MVKVVEAADESLVNILGDWRATHLQPEVEQTLESSAELRFPKNGDLLLSGLKLCQEEYNLSKVSKVGLNQPN